MKKRDNCPVCNKTKEKRSFTCSKKCSWILRPRKSKITKEQLEQDYINNKMEWKDISKKYNLSIGGLYKYMKRYDIPYRTKRDLTGETYGKLKVISFYDTKNTKYRWLCLCLCGEKVIKNSSALYKSKIEPQCESCLRKLSREKCIIKTTYWNSIIKNAKIRNLEFSITKEYAYQIYLDQKCKCALSGMEIFFSPSQSKELRTTKTASLDRIDSSKGYIIGNIQWVHKKINKMKMNLSEKEFVYFCDKVASYHFSEKRATQIDSPQHK